MKAAYEQANVLANLLSIPLEHVPYNKLNGSNTELHSNEWPRELGPKDSAIGALRKCWQQHHQPFSAGSELMVRRFNFFHNVRSTLVL